MTDDIYSIVEGPGEEKAVPLLLRRLLERLDRFEFRVPKSHKANGRFNIIKPGGLETYLERMRHITSCRGVLVLVDAEEESRECPPTLAYTLAHRSQTLGLPFPVVIVGACCEYESWFLYNLHTKIKDSLIPNARFEGDPAKKCGAKEWLSKNMPSGTAYKPTDHQEIMTNHIDIPHTIEQSRSFRRMADAVEELLAAIDSGQTTVTPLPPPSEET